MDISARGTTRIYLGLLRDRPFRSLLGSKLATRIATDALLYALLIHVVQETGSARYTTLLVLTYIMPAVLVGLAAGAVAEASPLRLLLLIGHLSRAVIVGGMLAFGSTVWSIYPLLLGLATIGQFVGPAEASAIPRLVNAEERPAAHSLLAFAAMAGTMLGAVTVGPIILKLEGWQAVLVLCAGLNCLAALLSMAVRVPRAAGLASTSTSSTIQTLLHGWHALKASPDALLALGYLTIAGALGKVLAAIAPYYAKDVLGISPENAVYIAVPAAVGALVALPLTPILGKAVGIRRTVDIGFFVLVLGLLSVGALIFVSNLVLTNVDLHIGYIEERVGPSSVITITMLMAILVGFGGTMLGIVEATTLNQAIAPASQARVASTSSTISATASLLPLFAVAAVADLVGVRAVLLVVATGGLAGALFLRAACRDARWMHSGDVEMGSD